MLQARKTYQHAIREEFTREIEALMGRKVLAFMSDNHMNPDVGIEALPLELGSASPARWPCMTACTPQ